jgi:hypothetical protein
MPTKNTEFTTVKFCNLVKFCKTQVNSDNNVIKHQSLHLLLLHLKSVQWLHSGRAINIFTEIKGLNLATARHKEINIFVYV